MDDSYSDALTHVYSHVDTVNELNMLRLVCRVFHSADTTLLVRVSLNGRIADETITMMGEINTILIVRNDGSIDHFCGMNKHTAKNYRVTGQYTRDKLQLSIENIGILYRGEFDIAHDSIIDGSMTNQDGYRSHYGGKIMLRRPDKTQTLSLLLSNPSLIITGLPYRFKLSITINVNGELCTNATINNSIVKCKGRVIDNLLNVTILEEFDLDLRYGDDRAVITERVRENEVVRSDEGATTNNDGASVVYKVTIEKGHDVAWI